MTVLLRRRHLAVLAMVLVLGAACGSDEGPSTTPSTTAASTSESAPTSEPAPTSAPAETTAAVPAPAVLLAAGDVASCDSDGDESTAALLDEHRGTVAVLGDLAYDHGTAQEFAECFDPSWGRHRDRLRPVPGNHDYGTPGAAAYFDYFGSAAAARGEGWYAYDLGEWRIIALNSVCWSVGGCSPGSPQDQWLRRELATEDHRCTLAYFHHAPFSSGRLHGGEPTVRPLVEALHAGGVDVVLTGHEHHYERLGRLDPSGGLDEERGIRHFVVGTGGNKLYALDDPHPSSEARFAGGYGLLRLELGAGEYAWEFVGVPGVEFTDAGAEPCH